MRKCSLWLLTAGLLLSCSPSQAQPIRIFTHDDEAVTPRELRLEGSDLAMPGFGISSTKNRIMKRLEYALKRKWLTQSQVDQFCNDLKKISDKELSMRETEGQLSFQNTSSIAKQLNTLNQRFEELVLVREQNSPGVEGFQAREALMLQRMNLAVAQGKMSNRKAHEIKTELKAIMDGLPEKDLNEEQTRTVAAGLNKINVSVEKELRNPSVASRIVPFSR